MKPRCKYRFAFFLCILILGEEMARARTAYERLNYNELPFQQNVDDDFGFEREDQYDDDDADDDDDDSGSGMEKKILHFYCILQRSWTNKV